MFNFKSFFRGGVHIPSWKYNTSALPITPCPAPEYVHIPLSMHIGAPATCQVAVGDTVKLGQLIGKAKGFVSSNIHSSVSGTVTGMERRFLPSGTVSDCVVIRNDYKDTLDESIQPRESGLLLPPEKIREILQAKGIVGMGGATFPTHVKYAPPTGGYLDTVIINGCECEPYLTADHRVLVEYARDVVRGLKYFMKAALASRGFIAIEDNKPDAIYMLQQLTAEEPNIKVVSLKEKYPQGAEKQLVYAVAHRIIPEGGLPANVGVVVDNAATAIWAAWAVKQDLPLYERVVTVSGNAVERPGNYMVRLGTLLEHVVNIAAGGVKGNLKRIISGGPMMGFSLHSLDFPIMKGSGGLLLFNEDSPLASYPSEQHCVHCGHCVDACPMHLEPTLFVGAAKRRAWTESVPAHITSCIECGSCAYVCPSHIPIVQYIRMTKQFLATEGKGGMNPYYN